MVKKNLNRQFPKEEKWPGNLWKMSQHSLALREMQIKTVTKSHLTPVRSAKLRAKHWWHSKATLVRSWWECKSGQPQWKTVMEMSSKITTRLATWSSNPTTGCVLKRHEHTIKSVYSNTVYSIQNILAKVYLRWANKGSARCT